MQSQKLPPTRDLKMDGLFLIDKPSGPTSFDVVRLIRRVANTRKVGHSGTLDPLASGLLVIAVGHGTKLVPYLMDTKKRYVAHIALGSCTDTDDRLGTVIEQAAVPALTQTSIQKVFDHFTGTIEQIPPKFSALKSGGEALYRKARRGEDVSPPARNVHIHSLSLIEWAENSFVIDISCGKGTYIRSLARDMAHALGTVGHLQELRRLETSGFNVESALELEAVRAIGEEKTIGEHIVSLADSLPGIRKVQISLAEQACIANGQPIMDTTFSNNSADQREEIVGVLDPQGALVALAKTNGSVIQPIRVFCSPPPPSGA